MVEAMDAKALSYAAGEFLEFSGVGILVFISRTLWINRTFVRSTSEAFYASIFWEANVCGFKFLCFGSAAYGAFCVEVVECCGMRQFFIRMLDYHTLWEGMMIL